MATRAVPAAASTLRILRLLSSRGALGGAAIARELDLPRSSVYELLGALREHGFVVHLPEERRYALGLGAFEIGSAYSRQAPIARLSRPLAARLVDRVHESCHVAVLHGREVYYVVEERARLRSPLVTDVGVRLPAHLTASGLAILAHLPRRQLLALFPHLDAFVDRTGVGPRRLSELRALLAQVTGRGFAVENGSVTPGFASVAAAVLDHQGYPVAGVACTFEAEVGEDVALTRADLAEAVTATAAQLAARLGGRA